MEEEPRTFTIPEIGLPPISIREIQAQGVKMLQSPPSPSPPILRSPRKKTKKKFLDIPELDVSRIFSHSLLTKQQRSDSERVVYRHDDQLAEAQRTTTILDEQVKGLRQENVNMKEFLRDILYTLNARGYESITDNRGCVIDLNRCQGEHFLDLKGRDVRAKHVPVKRIQAQEHLLKAYIGSQEKLIRSLVNQMQHNTPNEMIGTQLLPPSLRMRGNGGYDSEVEKSAVLEKEILAMVNSLTSAIERHPCIYTILKEQLFLESTCTGESDGILATVLSRHQQLMAKANHSQSTPPSSRRSDEGFPSTSTSTIAPGHRKPSYFVDLKRSIDYANFNVKSLSVVSALREKFRQQRPQSPGILMKTLTSTEDHRRQDSGAILRTGRPTTGKNPLGSAPSVSNLRDGFGAAGRHRRPSTSINEYSSQKTQSKRCWAL